MFYLLTNCFNHWFMLGWGILLFISVSITWSILNIKNIKNKQTNKIERIPLISIIIYFTGAIIFLFICNCSICYILDIANIIFGILVLALYIIYDDKEIEE